MCPQLPKRDTNKLKPVDVASGDLLVIKGKGEIVQFDEKDKSGKPTGEKKMKTKLTFIMPDGKEKAWLINYKSEKNLSKAWGDNTDLWDGKTVMIAIEDSPQFGEFIVLFPTKQTVSRGAGVIEEPVDDESSSVPF